MIRHNNMKLKRFLLAAAMGSLLCACLDTTAGTSEEAEGIVALKDKDVAGVAQKGPFVRGSSVVLKETSKAGNLKPTGREFFAMTRSNDGDFQIDGLNLESQYVRLTATGYYKRETTGENSECQISLNALADLSKTDRVNINILTHLEYDRTLELVKKGNSFDEAKKQAHRELMRFFNFEYLVDEGKSESLDVTGDGEADRALEKISSFMDLNSFFYASNCLDDDHCASLEYCLRVQEFLDDFFDILDGKGSDLINAMMPMLVQSEFGGN
ncbi:MAG: hypothetical protein IK012_01030 [Fibrobacter sp.]|uniref:hypothetical protein n=1 Tax=Fibrobacter sp. TaxID=35828 RepID=UPI0025BCAD63|nr:hypothetical protein [Fibrobacter sp.]MBR4783826.1 hypothetical protein [Fibrobacter sp.]